MEKIKLPDNTKISHMHLKVSDIKRSIKFYEEILLFKKLGDPDGKVIFSLADNLPDSLDISTSENALPVSIRQTGLFHAAYKVPGRKELASMFNHINHSGWKFQGFSDHGVSESLYLADPDGNGIEIYYDKPTELWVKEKNHRIKMYTKPLDLQSLISELESPGQNANYHTEFSIGHIHLKVSQLNKAELFYHRILGFDITQSDYDGALFMSAGGYHHHFGFNIWLSKNSSPPPSGSVGLHSFTISIPGNEYTDVISRRLWEANIQYNLNHDGSIETTDLDDNKIILNFN